MSKLLLQDRGGVHVFVTAYHNPDYVRVHGAVHDKKNKQWVFPAYPPFGTRVLGDLRKVDPGLILTPDVLTHEQYLLTVPERVANHEHPDLDFRTTPYEHQREGLSYVWHYPRFALFWDPGVGKTKVLVDLKRLLPNQRMLIVTPQITVRNWQAEFQTHAPGEFRVTTLDGLPKKNRATIAEYDKWDVLIASYGIARNLALPRLSRRVYKHICARIKNGDRQPTPSGLKTLCRSIRVVSDPIRQQHYADQWFEGATAASIAREAAAEAAATPQWLCDVKYPIIVADESHRIKATSAGQTQAVLQLAKRAARRYLMSGTPTLGDPRHLQPQMRFLSPAIFPEEGLIFDTKFLVRAPNNHRIVTGFQNLNIINKRVQQVSDAKTKEACLDLPDRVIIDTPYTISAEQQTLYNTLVSTMEADLGAFFETGERDPLLIQNAAVLLNKLSQVTSGFIYDQTDLTTLCEGCPHLTRCVPAGIQPYTGRCHVKKELPASNVRLLKTNPKLDVFDDLMQTLLADPKHKVIVWAIYKPELDIICAMLDRHHIDYVRMQGGQHGNPQLKIDKFNTDPNCRVYVGQIATGEGITLNAAAYTVYYSLDWSLGTYTQSIDRNYRVGQTKSVVVYRLIGDGTVDVFKARMLDEKKDIAHVLTGKIACVTCGKQLECLKAGTELFDVACVYKRRMRKTIAKAELI